MRNVLVKIVPIASLVLILVFRFGYYEAKHTNRNLVGTWELEDEINLPPREYQNLAYTLDFFNDGTGIVDGTAIKWQLRDGNRLQIDNLQINGRNSQINDIELSKEGTLLIIHYDGKDFRGKKARKSKYSKKGKTEGVTANSLFTFTDYRDEKKYKAVKIGNLTWMAENLNFEIEGSKCYDNKTENCEKYGRLYDWTTANEVCPNGWHLPSNVAWDRLYHFADGTNSGERPYSSETAGKYLKAKDGWEGKNGNGIDSYGFSALPGGGGYSDGDFDKVGHYGYWWSASENDATNAYVRFIGYIYNYAYLEYIDKSILLNVRCVQD